MKNMKRYLSIFLAFVLAAPLMTGCDNDLDEYPSDAPVPAPSDKFTTTIQFVSSLSDASFSGNYNAFSDYLVKLDESSWLTILDRADNVGVATAMQTAMDAKRWTAYAFNKMTGGVQQGSMLYLGGWQTVDTYVAGAKGIPTGNGSYVTRVNTKMSGVRTDKTEDGSVTGTTDVSFNVELLTARFDTADQIAAFGGKQGLLRACYDDEMSLLMIGTVKNELLGTLEAAALEAGNSYALKVIPVAEGTQYTIFMLTEERFWGLNGVEKTTLGNGIDAYDITVMW